MGNLSFGDLSLNLGKTMYEFKFRIPSYYTLLVRSLTVLEGIALASDPNYKASALLGGGAAGKGTRYRSLQCINEHSLKCTDEQTQDQKILFTRLSCYNPT